MEWIMTQTSIAVVRRRTYELLDASRSGDSWGRLVDVALITLIMLNVVTIILESVEEISSVYRVQFDGFAIFSITVFTVEYILRLWSSVESDAENSAKHPFRWRLRHALTPMLIVDLLAILPFYLTLIFPMVDLRFLRAVRMLRILKLTRYSPAAGVLLEVLRDEAPSFAAALFLLLVVTVVASCGIYIFEHGAQPEAFGSIPHAMWWAVAALTTVGYGDVTPITIGGKVFGAVITIVGIGMVALPAGILGSAFSNHLHRRQRRFRDHADTALADGHIDSGEAEMLSNLRHELGFSQEEAAEILNDAARHRRPARQDGPDELWPNLGDGE
jgi:voltage-gated potassium channel